MPGPGPHMIYALGSGHAMMHLSGGRFGPHHCVIYAVNAFFGPDMGSFAEWLGSTLGSGQLFGSSVEHWIHDPFYYALILGFPLSLLYSWASRVLIHRGVLDSFSGIPLTLRQSFLLIFAGSLSHFFLDHLFEENGHSVVYTWILSTGWWQTRAAVNPDAVLVVGLLCATLIGGFVYIYRVKAVGKSAVWKQHQKSTKLILAVTVAYCLWCASQIYVVRPAVGEEADLGVLVFLGFQHTNKQYKYVRKLFYKVIAPRRHVCRMLEVSLEETKTVKKVSYCQDEAPGRRFGRRVVFQDEEVESQVNITVRRYPHSTGVHAHLREQLR